MSNYSIVCLLAIVTSILWQGCAKDIAIKPVKTKTTRYLHISHTRTDVNPEIDSTAEKINYKKYKVLMLGGDLAENSSSSEESIQKLDTIFDLKNKNTLWSIGNHDDTNTELIENFTGRKSYYSYTKNGICFLVLNTELNKTKITDSQLDFFNTVTDTLQNVSHLIILHHKLLWMYDHPVLESEISTTSNAPLDDCSYCLNPNNFYADLYPKLMSISKKGIEVLCVGGDIGKVTKKFEFITEDGVYFLASGIDANKEGNFALVFEHDLTKKELTWWFEPIEKL